jgi:hypothetical protein
VCWEALAGAEAARTAAARNQPDEAPRHARAILSHADILGISAETAIGEARGIAQRLRCQPLLDRAADLSPAEQRMRAPMVTAPGSEEPASARDG